MDFNFELYGIKTITAEELQQEIISFARCNQVDYGFPYEPKKLEVSRQTIIDFIDETDDEFHNEEPTYPYYDDLISELTHSGFEKEFLSSTTMEFYIYLSAENDDLAYILFV